MVPKLGPKACPVGEPVVNSPSEIGQILVAAAESQAVARRHERNQLATRRAGAEVIRPIHREQADTIAYAPPRKKVPDLRPGSLALEEEALPASTGVQQEAMASGHRSWREEHVALAGVAVFRLAPCRRPAGGQNQDREPDVSHGCLPPPDGGATAVPTVA